MTRTLRSLNNRRGNAALVLVGSLVILGALIWLLMAMRAPEPMDPGSGNGTSGEAANGERGGGKLVVFCAAGLRKPVEAAAKEFEHETGVQIQLDYGPTGVLLERIKRTQQTDVYIAADAAFVERGWQQGALAESLPIARQHPVIAVQKGNPKNIESLADLYEDKDITYAYANKGASVRDRVEEALKKTGQWEKLSRDVKVTHPTVNDIAQAVQRKSIDAAIVWDAIARQRSQDLDIVEDDVLKPLVQTVQVAVVKSSKQPTRALMFARYLQASDRGQKQFLKDYYGTVDDGDQWVVRPRIVFYSGGVNRLAVEETLAEFAAREGVDISTKYGGCGILVSDIQTGSKPDAYFACDESFMVQVQNEFGPALTLSETDMVIALKQGNPRSIQSLGDLADAGVKVGTANPKLSALGKLTVDMLGRLNLLESVQNNVVVQTPTADLLVTQLLTGTLDAVIVYRANLALVGDKVDVIEIESPDARPIAKQPIAILKESKHPYLMRRLLDALTSAQSRRRFESVKFRWKAAGQ